MGGGEPPAWRWIVKRPGEDADQRCRDRHIPVGSGTIQGNGCRVEGCSLSSLCGGKKGSQPFGKWIIEKYKRYGKLASWSLSPDVKKIGCDAPAR